MRLQLCILQLTVTGGWGGGGVCAVLMHCRPGWFVDRFHDSDHKHDGNPCIHACPMAVQVIAEAGANLEAIVAIPDADVSFENTIAPLVCTW